MKKKISLVLITGILLLNTIIYAQQANYPIKTIDGTEYYVYTVQAAEGLYSISKKFGVTQSDINNANPQIHDGLKAGQEILIPKKKNILIRESQENTRTEYVNHTVEKQQTLFAISRKYDVSQESIRNANPQIAERGLHTGEIIRIPVKKLNEPEKQIPVVNQAPPKSTEPTPVVVSSQRLHIGTNETYITHTVLPKETLYSLSKIYNTEVDDIIRLNPGVDKSLKIGSEVKIPFNSQNNSKPATNNVGNTNSTQKNSTVLPTVLKSSYKIAYLLPLMVNDDKTDQTIDKFIEFYLGSLIAINNAKDKGINLEIYTYDTEKTETQIYSIINKPELQKMDLIFGPAYSVQIPILADFCKRRQINMVIPFSSNVGNIETNPYLFQFNPDKEIQFRNVVDLFKNRFKNANIIFVETGNGNSSEDNMDFFNLLSKKADKLNINYKTISSSDLQKNSIETYLTEGIENLILFESDKITSVQSTLNKLYDLNSKYNTSVLGQYSWRSEKGKKPKMYYIAPFSSNSSTSESIAYESKYLHYYGKPRSETNPRFDMLGYDLTSYFLTLMGKNGFNFDENTKSLKFNSGIQSDFNFKRTAGEGGFMNQQLFLIEDAAKRN